MSNLKISIPEFYAGQSVFLTGSTGFLGKVIVEKLLRSCSDIDKIYLLIRPKKGKNVNSRLTELTNSPAFDLIRAKNPSAFDKIVMIEGDISQIRLGLSESNEQLLSEKVTIMINAAATIRFDEPLKNAALINLRSIREMMNLAHKMKNLKAFVHTSTAFVNVTEKHQKEVICPSELNPHLMIKICEEMPNEILSKLEPIFIGNKINSYILTKNLAENLLFEYKTQLPISIVRPSIIACAISEPIKGWIDAYTAAAPFLDMISRGISCSFYISINMLFDLVPVDMVANAIIAASWKVINKKYCKYNNVEIYNIASGDVNPLPTKKFGMQCVEKGRLYPSETTIWYPQIRFFSKRMYRIDKFLTHFFPAYTLDVVRNLMGKKGKYVKIYNFIESITHQVEFALTIPHRFQTTNLQNLFGGLCLSDQNEFNFNLKTFNWDDYATVFYLGMKKYLTKDESVNSHAAQKRLVRLKIANYTVKTLIFVAITFIIVSMAVWVI